jgi:hypothetical protein
LQEATCYLAINIALAAFRGLSESESHVSSLISISTTTEPALDICTSERLEFSCPYYPVARYIRHVRIPES